jgi:hypothetical protein
VVFKEGIKISKNSNKVYCKFYSVDHNGDHLIFNAFTQMNVWQQNEGGFMYNLQHEIVDFLTFDT